MSESLDDLSPHLSEAALRERDAAEVAQWRHLDGQPLTADEQALAAQRFADLRTELQQQFTDDTQSNTTIQQPQGEQ